MSWLLPYPISTANQSIGVTDLEADLKPRIASWIGHANHGETRGLRRAIFGLVRFRRATAP